MSQTPSDLLERLQVYKAAFESVGITSLSELGRMELRGNVVARAGLTSPRLGDPYESEVRFSAARRAAGAPEAQTWQPHGGAARLLRAQALPGTVFVDKAAWLASEIVLHDDTVVVLKQPEAHLLIMAERLQVGQRVTFSWERIARAEPHVEPKPRKKDKAPTPDGLWGVDGEPGANGIKGNQAAAGGDAPDIEIWLLELEGRPAFDLQGQDGQKGGKGQDGGDGGDGSDGRDSHSTWFDCRHGPGGGGNGGPAGNGGDGGPGGKGGNGGQLRFYAPQAVIARYIEAFFVDPGAGRGGEGGEPGVEGRGGMGGRAGAYLGRCEPNPNDPRVDGFPRLEEERAYGVRGARGADGAAGGVHGDAKQFRAIDSDDFRERWSRPTIVDVAPDFARSGELVQIQGLHFSSSDSVLLEQTPIPTSYVSDTLLHFQVPPVPGGSNDVQIRQRDGTVSNEATIYILPSLDPPPAGGLRYRPGSRIVLTGGGFRPGALVRVNEQDMPDTRYIDPGHIECTLLRPANVAPNAVGEHVGVKVVLPDGRASNEITVVLDTYRLIALGDSVMWGQGLQEHEKIHALLARHFQIVESNIGVYAELRAHSGAMIGLRRDGSDDTFDWRTLTPPTVDGEVPTTYPTILQQCLEFADAPDTLDLVLLNGGINNVDIRNILNPFMETAELRKLIDMYCHRHMASLLRRVAATFRNARIVVTGYFPILSMESDRTLVHLLLIGAGFTMAQLGGAIVGGIIADDRMRHIVGNCRVFVDESRIKLLAAINEVNQELRTNNGQPRIMFAMPGFGPANAALAPNSWLWGVNSNFTAQDRVAGARAAACQAAGPRNVGHCPLASVGHPNIKGAHRIAQDVIDALSRDSEEDGIMRVRAGRTPKGQTNWQPYAAGGTVYGIFVDVDTSSAGFSNVPVYVSSLGGDERHWDTTGASAIYHPTPAGFRVYVRWAGKAGAEAPNPVDANSFGWHINWLGYEE